MAILPLKRKTLKEVLHGDVWQLEDAGVALEIELDKFSLLVWSLCDGQKDLERMTEVMRDILPEESEATMRSRVEEAIMTLTENGLLELVSSRT